MALELQMNKLPWYGQVILFAVLGLAGIGVFYYFYASPLQLDMADRQTRLDGLRADINKGMTVAAQLPEFQARVRELQGQLEQLRAVLPEEKDVSELLRSIQTLATQSNLTIRGFKPLATVTRTLHAEWPITLLLDGTYHNLGIFFDRVSKFSRIINVSGVQIRAKMNPEPNSTITAQCTATTFVLLETAPPAAGTQG